MKRVILNSEVRTRRSQSFRPVPGLLVLVCLLLQTASAAVLTHRYALDSDANDAIGGANGLLQGNAFVSNNAVVLDGTNSYVQLPNDLFTNYASISFELWFADGPVNSVGAQLYNFSGAQGSMNYMLAGQGTYLLGSVTNLVSLSSPVVGGTNHLVWTQDSPSHDARIYVNGRLAVENAFFTFTPARIGSTTNICIGGNGAASSAGYFKGRIFEFRTYLGALSPLNVACNDAQGPDQLPSDPGTLQAVRLVVPSPAGLGALFRAGVFADFASLTNVDISTQPDLILSSDNTNAIAIAKDQRLKTVAPGMANITAAWQGFSNTLAVTVAVPHDVALLHRYGFNEQTNDWIVHDSVNGGHGRVFGSASIASFTGNGALKMVGYPVASGAYAALPSGLISSLSEVTIETWVTWTPGNVPLGYGTGGWQRIFDFGNQSGGQGASYLFLTPATDNVSFTTKSLLHAAITSNSNFQETPRLNWTNICPTNVMSCVAVTYSPVRSVMKMYLNGVLVASGTATIPLSGIIDTNCWLGRSLFSVDPYFYGSYHEFRIYSGLLSDSDVAADYAAGPDVVGVDYVLHCFAISNSVEITWGPSAASLNLESSPTLGAGASWSPVSVVPSFGNGRFKSTIPISADAAFFRLRSQ